MATMMLCPRCWGSKDEPGTRSDDREDCTFCGGTGSARDPALSTHFRLSELLGSQTALRHGLRNDPTAEHLDHLTRVCAEVLEPVRERFDVPIRVTSGLRLPEVNALVSGSATRSAHPLGWAVDFVPLGGVSLKAVVDWVIASPLDYDQVIYEGTWVHVGRFRPGDPGVARKQRLMMFNQDGAARYTSYDPNDPRVR